MDNKKELYDLKEIYTNKRFAKSNIILGICLIVIPFVIMQLIYCIGYEDLSQAESGMGWLLIFTIWGAMVVVPIGIILSIIGVLKYIDCNRLINRAIQLK